MNEFSELQAVDFGLGGFIRDTFTGLNNQAGPKAYREFLGRPVTRQIYRHDAEDPKEFLKAFLAAQAAEKTAGGAQMNFPELPLVYYYRKPGLTNGTDKEATRRGRFMYSEDAEGTPENPYKFIVLPIVLDYKLTMLAWDKPTIDKLQLAWYAYTSRHDKFTCSYQIGATDVFDIPAAILDHKSLLFNDVSVPPGQDAGRLYAVSTGMQIATDIIFGAGVTLPDEFIIQGALVNYIT